MDCAFWQNEGMTMSWDGSAGEETNRMERVDERRQPDQDLPVEMERRRSRVDRRRENNRQYATFYIADHFLGVEVEKVQEVFAAQEIAPVPLSSPIIAGLINLRGEIVTAMDLRVRLGFPPFPEGAQAMSVVIRTPDGPVNLLVDQIGDVIEVASNLFEPPPETLNSRLGSVVEGVYKLEGGLFLALDINEVVKIADGKA